MESVAPVIEEGSKGQGDRQGGHLLLQHSTHTPVTVHQACWGTRYSLGYFTGLETGVRSKVRSKLPSTPCPPSPSAPPNAILITLTSKHHVGLGQSQVVTKGEGCVL